MERNLKKYKNSLKKERRDRNTDGIVKYGKEIVFINNRIQIFRKLADSIAWQMINDQKHIAKRLYLGQKPVNLLDSNIDFVVKTVKKMNEDKSSFSLISDITTFVQLGDVLKINTSKDNLGLSFIELKDGKINEKIFEIIDIMEKTNCNKILINAEEIYDSHFIEQFERVKNQIMRTKNVEKILKTGVGEDYHTGLELIIPENILKLDFYDDYIVEGLKQVEEKGWFCGRIDYCLFIGIYGKKSIFPDPDLIFRLACLEDISHIKNTKIKEKIQNKDDILPYQVYDIRNGLSMPLIVSLFGRNLPFDFIIDLIMGKAFMFLYFDFDIFFKILESNNIKARWSTHKEYENILPKIRRCLIKRNNRVIILDIDGKVRYLGDGLLGRILFDGITPLTSLGFFLTEPKFKK